MGKTVLIVDDSNTMRKIVARALRQAGIDFDEILEAGDGLEALAVLADNKVDVVLSDMAPNMSGNAAMDRPKSMYLVELALDMCRDVLVKDGSFIVKVFMGADFDSYMSEVKKVFKVVKSRKPESSRSRSREVYLGVRRGRTGDGGEMAGGVQDC